MKNMKKIVLASTLLVGSLLLTGCGETKDPVKTLTCTRTATIMEGVKTDLKYEVTYQGEYVKSVKSTEKIITEDESVLNVYKQSVEAFYSPYSDIEHYEYDVAIDGDTLTSIANVDYEKIDMDKLIEIDSANAQLIEDGKVKLETIQATYEQYGAICK